MSKSVDRGGRRQRRSYSRADHRARSHDTAHADAPPETAGAVPQHPLVPRGAPSLVGDNDQLRQLIERLRAAKSFAYDSEFIGELTYVPKLCLIQTASPEQVALIDPLVPGLDLTPLWELLCDPGVEKIVHAGDQDVEPVVRHLGRGPADLFDTQISAGFATLPYPVSLSKLVQELTGARLGKGLTFTHWDQRPLSDMQLRYAADDVRYLPLVRAELGRRLEASGHAAWAAEACAAMCEPSQYGFDPETQYLRVRGAGSLQPRNLAVLRGLTVWRDGAARAENVPPRAFLKDEVLVDLARNPVKSVDKLDRVRGLPRPVENQHGPAIVEATTRAMSLPVPDLPSSREVELSPSERFHSDALWGAAQVLCAGGGVDSAVVTSRQELGELYRMLSTNQDPSGLRLMQGWRREVLGEPLRKLYQGTRRVQVDWSKGALRASEIAAGA